VIALALICGLSAVVVLYQFRSGSGAPSSSTVPVLTAKVDVMRGSVLDADSVRISQYPKQQVPKGALSSVDELEGRAVLFPLSAGEPIVQSRLTPKHGGHGLASMIPEGMRAFTIQTPHVAAGVGGFIQPGDKVDILLTTAQGGQDDVTGGGVTTTLLQNIQVLAVAQRLDSLDNAKDSKAVKGDLNDFKSVTLLVTPDQAAKVDLGMNRGILHLALRNLKDEKEARTLPATMAQLRFHQEKPINLADMFTHVAGAAGRVANMMTPKETPMPPKEASTPAPTRPPIAEIWTLRGSHASTVLVDLRR
jgi:pilus assembly protein CpaB